ncbi:MAG TPA: DUF1552 domain-containing protein [Polyangiaceae bacterium]|nr:DUF1552 domain-containing protein [Polyangiaceae bacterium]
MKLSSRQRVGRRDLVRLIGSAAFALPCLELFGRELRAQAAGKLAKYAVFCYTPDGVNQAAFWPKGGETDFELSPILTPFAAHRDKLLVMGPQVANGSVKSGTGLAYAGPTPQHQAPVTLAARVGHGCKAGGSNCTVDDFGLPYLDQSTAVNNIDGPSIDQVIGKAVVGNSLFSSLNFGLHPIGGDTPSDINFAENGSSLKRMASADEAWNRVFGMPAGPSASDVSAARKQTAVTDFLHARFTSLRPQLSAYDQQVLDAHLTSLRAYEEQVKKRSQSTCQQPVRAEVPSDATSVRTGADTEKLAPFYMDLITSAFSCDLTKVATVTFGYPGGGDAGGLRMPWLGFTDPLHMISHHGGDASRLDKYKQMHTWIAKQIAGLLDRLAAVKDANGTSLLDQTVVYWFNRHGDGDSHSNWGLPNILLGGAGGYFKMGRYLQLPTTNPTQVLISIANSMGVDVPTFGEAPLAANKPLSALTG